MLLTPVFCGALAFGIYQYQNRLTTIIDIPQETVFRAAIDVEKEYGHEIQLASDLIIMLDTFYKENGRYPFLRDEFFEVDIISAIDGINELTENYLYYIWLIDNFVLTFLLEDGTGLLFHSGSRLWQISEHLP